MKVFLYRDKVGASKVWHNEFSAQLSEMKIDYLVVDFDGFFKVAVPKFFILRFIKANYEQGDIFICRVEERRYLRLLPWYEELVAIFGETNVFPSYESLWLYDNKMRQGEIFNEYSDPSPKQAFFKKQKEAEFWMKRNHLDFPLVRKNNKGSASKGVSLADSLDINYPCLLQEFCPENEGDFRICVIGHRVMGFFRGNRDNDFRASGSGKLIYTEDLPMDAVGIAWTISNRHQFPCMAYDFVKNARGEWVVIEMSYTFNDDAITQCRYYLDATNNYSKEDKINCTPEQFIIEDLLILSA